jgi:hypothetical protein
VAELVAIEADVTKAMQSKPAPEPTGDSVRYVLRAETEFADDCLIGGSYHPNGNGRRFAVSIPAILFDWIAPPSRRR